MRVFHSPRKSVGADYRRKRRKAGTPGSLAHVEATAMAIEMVASEAKASIANRVS
jgi:hypothetical protein